MSFLILRRVFTTCSKKNQLSKHPYSKEWIHNFVAKLEPQQLELLKLEINKCNSDKVTQSNTSLPFSDLRKICIAYGLPFIGFGLLDNGIMILAGEYIDIKLGILFGMSTMAAAGFGNLISDVVGIGTVGYIETMALKVGVKLPHLTAAQRQYRSVKFAGTIGRLLGITIGCLLGMLPLLMFDFSSREKKMCEKKLKIESKKE